MAALDTERGSPAAEREASLGGAPPARGGWAARAAALVAALAIAAACGRGAEPASSDEEPAAGAARANAGRSSPAELASAGDEAFAADDGARKRTGVADGQDEDDADDEDDIDYWKGVKFDVQNFDEVIDYVTTYYIDDKVDLQRAWVAAANGALGVLEPDLELLPQSFLQARKGHADEEGRLDGQTEPFVCEGETIPGVVLHRIPGSAWLKYHEKKMPDRRLTDEEIAKLRADARSRYAAYRSAWTPISFGRKHFLCAIALVDARLPAARKEVQARLQAPLPPPVANKEAADAKAAGGGSADAKAAAGDSAPGGAAGATGPTAAAGAATSAPSSAKGGGAKAAVAKVAPAEAAAPATPPGLYDELPLDADDRKRVALPDSNRSWLAASAAYLYALDPHSAVIARKQWDESTRKTQDSSFEGIGAVLTQRDKRTIVENPMEDLPAWRSGVRAGDEILMVDGVDIRGWMLSRVVDKIRGKKNTRVELTLQREGEPKPLVIGIVRAHIPIKNVTGKLLPEYEGVAHIKMSGFVPRSTSDLRTEIETLAAQAPGGKLKGLILDLRRNSGGLLNRAIDIADLFLERGRIVSVKSRHKARAGKSEEVYDAKPDKDDYDFPMVVLVDDGAASASEIVASALQENGRALVVGLRTFGKASVQTLFEPALHLDYYVKLTVARYYAPSGHTIQVTGVHPDVVIPPKVDGKIPVGFREENLTNHLDPIDAPAPSPLAPLFKALQGCVESSGIARKIATREPKPQVAPDFQVLSAADHLLCLARLQAGK